VRRDALYPWQEEGAERLSIAIRRFGGALLCDSVGLGKSRTALATARKLGLVPSVLCPPALRSAWQKEANDCDIDIEVVSLGVMSQPRASPRCLPGRLAIIDEAHHLRARRTVRRRRVAEWIGQRPSLWVTATPVVNAPADLGALLAMVTSRGEVDALAVSGDWDALIVARRSHEVECALPRRMSAQVSVDVPALALRSEVGALATAAAVGSPVLEALFGRLAWRRWLSSPEALQETVRRWARYVEQLEVASRAGRALPRATFERMWAATAGEGVQQVFTFVLPEGVADPEKARLALQRLRGLVAWPRWCDTPQGIATLRWCRESSPTLLFTEYAATARTVATQLEQDGHGVVLVGGSGARVTHVGAVSVEQGLSLARDGHDAMRTRPTCVVLTPVAVEGLNLQFARQVIHLDLPWTPARLEQRVGRAARLGGHSEVEVRTLVPTPALESYVGVSTALSRKAQWLSAVERREWGELWEQGASEVAWLDGGSVVTEIWRRADEAARAGCSTDLRILLAALLPAWSRSPPEPWVVSWRQAGLDVRGEWPSFAAWLIAAEAWLAGRSST
jgi:hypothetical protein